MTVFHWLLPIAGVCTALILPILLLQRELDYCNRRLPAITPERFGLPYNDIKLETSAGFLTGWYLPVPQSHAPAVVMLHGLGGNAADLLPFARVLHKIGFNILLLNASAHADSSVLGRSDMVRFSRDLELGLQWLKAREEVNIKRIMLMGHSLAGAAALLLGSRRNDIAGIITFGAFAHSRSQLEREIRHRTRYPFWPFGWFVIQLNQLRLGFNYDKIAPINTILTQSAPVLLLHGELDEVVPVKDARRIAANGGHQTTLIVDKAGRHVTFLKTSIKLNKIIQKFAGAV